jgi:phosphohistidine swiveling domain-containing protein
MDTERQAKFQPHIDEFAAILKEEGWAADKAKLVLDDMIPGIVGFDAKRPDATEEEVLAFVAKLGSNVSKAHVRKAAQALLPNSPENRAARTASLAALEAEHHVHFAYLRETYRFVWPTTPPDAEDDNTVPGQLPEPPHEEVEVGDKNGVIAFKYHLSMNNTLLVEYAISYCSSKDRFDSLVGKEKAMERFLAKQTLTVEASRGALFGSLVGPSAPLIIAYAKDVLKANGVVREVVENLNIHMWHQRA